MYSLRILDAASHDLAGLDKQIATRIVKRIYWLAENFDSVKLQSLTGDLSDLYKLRVGDYRILYEALREEKVLVIHTVGHRREIYRSR